MGFSVREPFWKVLIKCGYLIKIFFGEEQTELLLSDPRKSGCPATGCQGSGLVSSLVLN